MRNVKFTIMAGIAIFLLVTLSGFILYKYVSAPEKIDQEAIPTKEEIIEDKCSSDYDSLQSLQKEIQEYEQKVDNYIAKVHLDNNDELQKGIKDLDDMLIDIEENYEYFICHDEYTILLNSIHGWKTRFKTQLAFNEN